RGTLELAAGHVPLEPLEVVPGELRELELGPPRLHSAAAFDEALLRKLRLRFVGEGRLHVQVVARGLLPWEQAARLGAAAARGEELQSAVQALLVQVRRPAAGRVGEP